MPDSICPTPTWSSIADDATHAGSAGEAEHAEDASTLGGLDAKAFMPAGQVLAGSAQTWAVPAQTFLTSPLGFRLETDVDCLLPAAGTGSSRSFCMSIHTP